MGRLAGFVQDGGQPRCVLLLQDLEILRAYRVTLLPSYLLLDKKGVVSWVSDGPIEASALAEAVRAALAGGEQLCAEEGG